MRVLLIEDDPRVREVLVSQLKVANFAVDCAASRAAFEETPNLGDYRMYLLDLNLPDGSGLDILRRLRREQVGAPILVLTGRQAVRDRVIALELGADDFLVKPFHLAELLARMKAVLRRVEQSMPRRLKIGSIEVDCDSMSVLCDGLSIVLRPSEQRLLVLLIQHLGRVVSRSKIERAIHEDSLEVSPNAIDKLVSRLRRQLEAHPTGLQLRTIKGAGYVLEPWKDGRSP